MGVHEGRGQLAKAMKELMLRWNEAKSAWRDGMSEKFEQEHLRPLEMDLKNATGAMDLWGQILAQARRDCGND